MRLGVLLAAAVAVVAVYGAAPDTKGFVPLFDGKTLDGWVQVGKEGKGYVVEDGKIVLHRGDDARLYTGKEYTDFIFRFEFKLEDGSNNGLAIRGALDDERPAYAGIELQILDNTAERYKGKLRPTQAHGSVYDVLPAKTGYLKPAGEWNRQEVTVKGSRVKVVLNGHVILDEDLSSVTDPEVLAKHPGLKRKKGRIGFLGHDEPIELRNLMIREL